MKNIKISKHAIKRFKKRTGIPKKNISKRVRSAYTLGKSENILKGTIKNYINDLMKRHPEVRNYNIKIWSGFVWIFIGTKLITLYPIPGSLTKYILN